mmetsp:Transcript_87082/g.224268  ORF Transcript_87082/g.224268 Transcript_87082/m.224268 type:complete len:299 (+) Transcript_87082:550-1446(+)
MVDRGLRLLRRGLVHAGTVRDADHHKPRVHPCGESCGVTGLIHHAVVVLRGFLGRKEAHLPLRLAVADRRRALLRGRVSAHDGAAHRSARGCHLHHRLHVHATRGCDQRPHVHPAIREARVARDVDDDAEHRRLHCHPGEVLHGRIVPGVCLARRHASPPRHPAGGALCLLECRGVAAGRADLQEQGPGPCAEAGDGRPLLHHEDLPRRVLPVHRGHRLGDADVPGSARNGCRVRRPLCHGGERRSNELVRGVHHAHGVDDHHPGWPGLARGLGNQALLDRGQGALAVALHGVFRAAF